MTIRMRRCTKVISMLAVLFASSLTAVGADSLPSAADLLPSDASHMKIVEFGELPVRFNGRVTTLGSVAPVMLKNCSDRDFVVDNKGRKQTAVRWLLDVIARTDGANKYNIVPIQRPELLTLLGFDEDPKVRRFRARRKKANPPEAIGPPRFSMAELESKLGLMDQESRRILQGEKFEDYNDYHRAFSDVRIRMHRWMQIATLHQFQESTVDLDELKRRIHLLQSIESNAMFQMVPAADVNGRWQTILRADVELLASEALKKKPNVATKSLKAIVDAYRKKDVDTFNRRLAEYQKWVKTNGVAWSPFSYTLPKTWREAGVPLSRGAMMFLSVEANGDTVAQFDIGEKDEPILAFVRHFTGKTMTDAQIYNGWRIGFGLMPLSETELEKIGTPITIAGHKGYYVDLTPSKLVDTSYKQTLGTVVRHGDHTFVINVGLPQVVTHHIRTFEAFATSLKFALSADLSRWFADSQPFGKDRFRTTAAALVPDGTRLWSFQLVEHASGIAENSQQAMFEAMIRSITPLEGNAKAGIQWDDPVGWDRQALEFAPLTYLLQGRLANAQIVVHAVGDPTKADRLPLVNLWRVQTGLPVWKREQMEKASRDIRVAGRTVTLLKFEAPPAAAAAEKPGSPRRVREFEYEVPKGWVAAEPKIFQKARFLVQDGDQRAEISVAVLPNAKKDFALVRNVNRWRAQLKLDPQDEKTIRASLKKVKVADNAGHLLDMNGGDAGRIVVAIVERDKTVWFFKIRGDEQLVGKQKKSFEAFVQSVKFLDPLISMKERFLPDRSGSPSVP